MSEQRKPLGKKIRFEVFKRDKFTCQYCGSKAPDVVLHVDHIQPVAEGGSDDLMNLITSCVDCNSGKGARLLTDDSVVERQRKQIEDLEERRQQLEMMLQWREGLSDLKEGAVDAVVDNIAARSKFTPNENGRQHIRRWLKRFSVDELLSAADESFDVYLLYNGDKVIDESWEKAFSKIPAVAEIRKQQQEKPYLRDLFYIQGILRKRTRNKWLKCVEYLEEVHKEGISISTLMQMAKRVDTWEEFDEEVGACFREMARQ